MPDLPLVACLTPTFGRAARQPAVLREAVADFLAQDYPADRRLLLILNDAPGHVLTTALPGVLCLNMHARMPSLGAKCNAMLALAKGRGCAVGMMWEDDDRAKPFRVSQAVRVLGDYDYWNPGLVWFHQRESAPVPDGKGVMHHAAAFKIDKMLGRYQNTSRGHDAAADGWARANLRCCPVKITDPAEAAYVYRWGFSDFHLSGQADMEAAYRAANPGPPGVYEITV